MPVKGLGTDIVQISRIAEAVAKSDRLAKRVLAQQELDIYFEHSDKGRYLAKRWAAKEAAAKALGTGIGRGISFQHFYIENDEMGAPMLTLFGAAKELAEKKGITHTLISISDETDYAMATVILE